MADNGGLPDIDALRAEVARKHRAATRKISRLRARGIRVGGSEFDVRRDLKNVKRYTRSQLNAYARNLDSFTSRSNQFMAGDSGAPIPAKQWRAYKTVEARYNARGADEFRKVADTFIPTSGLSIRERQQILSKRAHGSATNAPFQQVDRDVSDVTSADAVRALTMQLRHRLSRDFTRENLKESRRQMFEMLKEVGAHETMERVSKLSNHQFNVLWNYTNFAEELSTGYELARKRAVKPNDRAIDSMEETSSSMINEMVGWAEILPKTSR